MLNIPSLSLLMHHEQAATPEEFKNPNFSHIPVLARALARGKGDVEKLLDDLDERYILLDDLVQTFVDENYKGFNRSIRHFSDVIQRLNSSESAVKSLQTELKRSKELLSSRSDDLSALWLQSVQCKEYISILDLVEEIKGVPDAIRRSMAGHHYLHAVRLCHKYERVMKQEQVADIGALRDIKEEIADVKRVSRIAKASPIASILRSFVFSVPLSFLLFVFCSELARNCH